MKKSLRTKVIAVFLVSVVMCMLLLNLLCGVFLRYIFIYDTRKAMVSYSAQIEKEYIVETAKPVTEELMMKFVKGFVIEGVKYRIQKFSIKSPVKIHIILTEGKNREIRRFFQFHSIKEKKLHRIRIGSVRLESSMLPGSFRELTPRVVGSFIKKREGV